MVVAPAEIRLIATMRRRMMRLPVLDSVPCPVRVGRAYRLQPRPFAPAEATVTVTVVRREALLALTPEDARREGYGSVQGALDAWQRAHGEPAPEQRVWVVSFVCGDHSEFTRQDEPVYLAKHGDYTTRPAKAVLGEPEVTILPGAGESARVMALARRQRPVQQKIDKVLEDVESLKAAMLGMKARNRAKLIERELTKLRQELPVTAVPSTAVPALADETTCPRSAVTAG